MRTPKSLRKKSEKKAGGQAGHQGTTLHLSASPDRIIVHEVEQCVHCQQDLHEVEAHQVERRQVVELPPRRVEVIEHQAERKCCPKCQHVTLASFPQGVQAPVQYGPALSAVAVYLVQQQLVPYERACEILFDLFGHCPRAATLCSLVERCAEVLGPVEEQIKHALSQSEVLNQDETGLYVAGKRHWVHVSATKHLTHYTVHAKRGKEALDTIGILTTFEGVSVHDGWSSYWSYACRHALCNVHLLRDLTFVQEEEKQEWAGEMKRVLLDMKAAVEQAQMQGRESLHPLEMQDWKARYQALLVHASEAPSMGQEPSPKRRGRRKQSAAHNLLHRLIRDQDAVLAFMENFAVPFDNNLAERDLRMLKVQQKISGCFRSVTGAQAFCRIRGYLSTLRKQNFSLLRALEQALMGHPFLPAF
ncbi:MAG: IS66 family transposase [Ktedonobacteraceae bacterium]